MSKDATTPVSALGYEQCRDELIETLEKLKPFLETIKPMPAVFDQYYVKRLNGTHVKKGRNKRELAEQVIADIRNFK